MTRQMADDEVLRVIDALGDLARHRLTMKRRDFDKMVAAGKEPHWAVVVKAERAEYLQEQACDLRAAVAALQAERDALRVDVERETVRLAGCGVAAMSNTRESLERARQVKPGDYGHSASYDDCIAAVGREIDNRERAERAESALEALRGQVAGLVALWRDQVERGTGYLNDESDRAVLSCADELDELLAIKERMG